MKKLLLFILFSISIYGQNPTRLPYGVQITGGQTATAESSKILSQQPGSGTVNYINATALPLSTEAIKALKNKAFLSTGLIKNGLIQTGTSTTFNITAGIGVISNFDDPENPTSTIVSFPAFTGITPTYLTSGNITYVAINSSAAVVMQASPFTDIQRRDLIILGAVIHSNLSTINTVNNISAPTNSGTNQLHDLYEFIGALNLSGNKYTANGANLSLNKSAGDIGKLGVNFANNWKSPNKITIASGTALTFRYRTQNGTEGSDVTSVNPAVYDVANVLTAVPSNRFSIQTVTLFQTGLTRIQYGQSTYATMSEAEAAITTRSYNVEANIMANGITRAYIILKNNTTSLQNASDCKIVEVGKFGNVSGSGGAITLDAIIAALGYTPENQSNKSDSYTASSSTTYASTKAVVDGLGTKVGGSGTTNYLPKFTGSSTLGNSIISEVSGKIGINKATPTKGFQLGATDGNGGFSAEYIDNGVVIGNIFEIKSLLNGKSFYVDRGGTAVFQNVLKVDAGGIILGTNGFSSLDVNGTNGTKLYGAAGIDLYTITNTDALHVKQSGEVLINTATNNGVDKLQVNGSASISSDSKINTLTIGKGGGNMPNNTAIGQNALQSNTTGSENGAFGKYALIANTTGSGNTAVGGWAALYGNTTGDRNTAVGDYSLFSNTTASDNTANGYQSSRNNVDGASNSALGMQSLYSNISGANNTSIGYRNLFSNLASGNTAIGSQALYFITTGANNTAVGKDTGLNITTGSGNTILGANVTGLAAGLTNNIILANGTGAIKAQHDGTNWTLTGGLNLSTSPTTSAGTYDILTRNSSTGVVEKVLSSSVVSNAGTFTSGRIPYTSSTTSLTDSSMLLWDNTNSYLEVNGTAPRFIIKNNINNYYSYLENTTSGTLFLKNHQNKTLAFFTNPIGSTAQPQLAIGQVSSIPTESQLYVYGGQSGANIDARGSATADEANIDLEGNNWETSINSLGLSYFGSNATAFGTVMGYAKNKLGQIRFQDNTVSAITSYKESGVSPIRFGINDVQIANVSDIGLSYQSDFSSVNSSNPRWLVDKAYVDNVKPYKSYVALLTQTSTNAPTATVLENSLGGAIVWTYGGAGYYYGTLSGAFVNNKTYATLSTGLGAGAEIVKVGVISNNQIMVTVANSLNAATDGVLYSASLEIRVYN